MSEKDKIEILNDDKYNVEIAQDITIPTISSNPIDVKDTITGYTAGLITRDLVSKGEEIIKNRYKKKNNK